MKKPRIEPIAEESNYSIVDLKIEQLLPNSFNNYLVTIYEGHQLVVLPPNAAGPHFKTWRKSRGGQFAKDVLLHTLNKDESKYILVRGEGQYFIARLISDDEKLRFESLKLIDGQIKDHPFMILRTLHEEDSLTNTRQDLSENLEEDEGIFNENEDPDSEVPTIEDNDDEDNEMDYRNGSVSLFSNDE